MKILLTIFLLTNFLFAQDLTPTNSYKSSGNITDIFKKNKILYSATNRGIIDIFDLNTHTLKEKIKLPTTRDFLNDEISPKIFSIDLHKKRLLIVSQGKKGFRNIYTFEDKILIPIITYEKKFSVTKAKFISENEIIFSLLSNEVILYDLNKKSIIWKKQINTSRFSDFVLNANKTVMALTDESGEIFLVNTKNGKTISSLSGQNVDNVYQLDYKNSKVVGAGQDRRVSFYNTKTLKGSYFKSSFLVYSVGLSPSGNLIAYSSNEQNDIAIIKSSSFVNMHNLKGHKSLITKILFANENEVFTASDDQYINYWKLN